MNRICDSPISFGGEFMLNGCFFEYAGQYSGVYNLRIVYIENSYDKLDSGGSYEPVVDTLPNLAESLLYGLKYAEKPLEFSVEIINPDKAISIVQMRKIKSWLFGQNGWKTFRLKDKNFQPYHLKCMFIPEEDIVDSLGYRGVRCKLKNVSPFWYGETKTKVITEEDMTGKLTSGLNYELNINVDTDSTLPIPVVINFTEPDKYDGVSSFDVIRSFWVKNVTNGSLLYRFIEYDYKGASWSFDTRFLQFKSLDKDSAVGYAPVNVTSEIFYLQQGNNKISIACHDDENNIMYYKQFSISYTPCYRIGGF